MRAHRRIAALCALLLACQGKGDRKAAPPAKPQADAAITAVTPARDAAITAVTPARDAAIAAVTPARDAAPAPSAVRQRDLRVRRRPRRGRARPAAPRRRPRPEGRQTLARHPRRQGAGVRGARRRPRRPGAARLRRPRPADPQGRPRHHQGQPGRLRHDAPRPARRRRQGPHHEPEAGARARARAAPPQGPGHLDRRRLGRPHALVQAAGAVGLRGPVQGARRTHPRPSRGRGRQRALAPHVALGQEAQGRARPLERARGAQIPPLRHRRAQAQGAPLRGHVAVDQEPHGHRDDRRAGRHRGAVAAALPHAPRAVPVARTPGRRPRATIASSTRARSATSRSAWPICTAS